MTHALPRPFPRAVLFALGCALAAGLAALALVKAIPLDPGHEAFSLTVPKGWRLSHSGSSLVVRSHDRHGAVVISRAGDVRGSLRTVATQLTRRFAARVPGFRLIGARVGRVRAGSAFVYTFVRPGAAQTLTLTKVHGILYRIDSVVRAGSPGAARAAGAAIASFGP